MKNRISGCTSFMLFWALAFPTVTIAGQTFLIGGALFSDCSDPLGSGQAGITVSVTCDGGFSDSTSSFGGQGLWAVANVPEDACCVTVAGFCSVDSVCPPDPCNDTVCITVDAAHQAENQSLAFWENVGCGDGSCAMGEDSCTCPDDCGDPPSTETNCDDGVDNDCDGSIDDADDDCAQPTFTIGGALFSDCPDPLGSGQAGLTVNVTCDGGFSGSTTSFGGQGLWAVANVPEDACCVTAVGFCSVDSVCPPDPCNDTVCIAVDAAHQADNQSLVFWECVGGDCEPACHGPIVSSEPPSGAIDAREPHSVSDANDVSGWSSLEVTMGGTVESCGVDEFSISEIGGGPPLPVIVAVVPVSEFSVRLDLDRSIEPGAWTVITHKSSGSKVCLGFLPADASQDRLSASSDIIALINSINLVAGFGLPDYATDINRSGITNGQDILRLIDLLNGADAFNVWIAKSLPANPCDS